MNTPRKSHQSVRASFEDRSGPVYVSDNSEHNHVCFTISCLLKNEPEFMNELPESWIYTKDKFEQEIGIYPAEQNSDQKLANKLLDEANICIFAQFVFSWSGPDLQKNLEELKLCSTGLKLYYYLTTRTNFHNIGFAHIENDVD